MHIQPYSKSGFSSSLYHLKPLNQEVNSQTPLFVFIPGNPGLIEFYKSFLDQIQKKHGNWEILGISHAGMITKCKGLKKPTKVYSLKDQVQHKVYVINDFCSSNRPLIIAGHSIGAYIVQKIALDVSLVGTVKRIMLLTPTVIDIHLSEKGRKLNWINEWCPNFHSYVANASWLVFEKMLPQAITEKILSLFVGSEQACVREATKLLVTNYEFVQQSLGLAREEMQKVRDDWNFQLSFLQFCKSQEVELQFVFAFKDHWVNSQTRFDLAEFYSSNYYKDFLTIDEDEKISHSFVLNDTKSVVDRYI